MTPYVVSPATLIRILTHHPSFRENAALHDVTPIITTFAMRSRLHDLTCIVIPCFRAWCVLTPFHPRQCVNANIDYIGLPVCEYVIYHDRLFTRRRHCLGVTFASRVTLGKREVGVVWSTTRKAYLFEYSQLVGWTLFKVLNRQDDPFLTWLRYLGGAKASGGESYPYLSAKRLFRDLVVPYFGCHPLSRNMERTLSIPHYDPLWELVRRVSYMTLPDDAQRLVWKRVMNE
jgi:hypothetical protein